MAGLKVPDGEQRTSIVRVLVTPAEHERLTRRATSVPRRSLSTWARAALLESDDAEAKAEQHRERKAKNGAAHPPPEEGGGP